MTGRRGRRGGGRAPHPPPAVPRSLPGPGLHPRRVLAVPEVRGLRLRGPPARETPGRLYRSLPRHAAGPRRPRPAAWLFPPSKDQSGFAAPPLVSRGVAVVVVGYDTAPKGRCCPAEPAAACAGPAPSRPCPLPRPPGRHGAAGAAQPRLPGAAVPRDQVGVSPVPLGLQGKCCPRCHLTRSLPGWVGGGGGCGSNRRG